MEIDTLDESDLIELFVHSSGKGGQNVNKVATCVYLKHVPSGIEVKCSKFRTQNKNREEARRLLLDKIIESKKAEKDSIRNRIQKNFRRNRKKTAAQKQIMIEEKRKLSKKKTLRKKPSSNDKNE